MTKFEIVQGDITQQPDIEVIVNAANTALIMGEGVCGAVYRAAGIDQLYRAVKYLYEDDEGEVFCHTGQCVHTPAFDLPNKYIIHAVGPIWRAVTGTDLGGVIKVRRQEHAARLLASAYSQSLILADVLGAKSIAFPAISTGIYGYPPEEAAEVAAEAVTKTVIESTPGIELVRFVCFDQNTEELLRSALVVSAIDVLLPADTNTDEQLTLPFPD